MTTIRRRLPIILPLLVALAPFGAVAQNADNAKERIRSAGRLISLSQALPATACHLVRDIGADEARPQLARARAEFNQTLAALEHGDSGLNIRQPETRRKTLHEIGELRKTWAPVGAMTDSMESLADLGVMLDRTPDLLAVAEALEPELVEQYANPFAVTYAELHQIGIAGRQVMLTHRIAKQACILGTPLATAETVAELQTTMQIFEASLDALRHGMPALGLQPPPNEAVSDGLEEVRANWLAVKPALEAVLAGEGIGEAQLGDQAQRLNATAAIMEHVVELYANGVQPGS